MLQNDSENSGKPYDWATDLSPYDPDPEWATEEEINWIDGRAFDMGWCLFVGIVPPDFETS
jgi:hypothetical protein